MVADNVLLIENRRASTISLIAGVRQDEWNLNSEGPVRSKHSSDE